MSILLRYFLGDFFGTGMLILLGNGVNTAMSYNKMYAKVSNGKNWVGISFGWGLAVLLGVLISNAFSGVAHLNPAVTILFAIKGDTSAAQFGVLIVAQILGAMFGQIVLNLITFRHAKDSDWLTIRSCHCTAPAYPKAIFQNFGMEFVGTVVLLGAILSIGVGTNKPLGAIAPVIVMWIVVSIGFSLGSTTGYAINPARDLAPRIIYFLIPNKFLNQPKATANWVYSWIPVLAPISAAVVLGILARFITV